MSYSKNTMFEELENLEDTPEQEAPSVLEEAHGIIYGDREATYGDPGINLRRIAALWTAYLSNKSGDAALTADDVAMMMVLLKIARQQHQTKRDNLVDACGYLALIERVQCA